MAESPVLDVSKPSGFLQRQGYPPEGVFVKSLPRPQQGNRMYIIVVYPKSKRHATSIPVPISIPIPFYSGLGIGVGIDSLLLNPVQLELLARFGRA